MFSSSNICTDIVKEPSIDISTVDCSHKESNMTSIVHSIPGSTKVKYDMAVVKNIPDEILHDKVQHILSALSKRDATFDEVDNPQNDRMDEIELNKDMFEAMKFEINRLNSFSGKWPLEYVKPNDLAKVGLFYLQSEDKVQCAFCNVLIDDWNVGDKPLREHMKKSPKCPFLMTTSVGNVPIVTQSPPTLNSVHKVAGPVSSSNKPRHPRMSDVRTRILTYKNWPLIMLSSKQLAECGLYYTGVADVVTCFFCGGSLGNWELNDNPWTEHVKFFPNCAYMALARKHGKFIPNTVENSQFNDVVNTTRLPSIDLKTSVANSVFHQACVVFPTSLVQEVVTKRKNSGQAPFTSLQEICDAVLEHKENERRKASTSIEENPPLKAAVAIPKSDDSKLKNMDLLLCKICMDRERGVVFQPCGHLVSCTNCAQLIFNCPMCRSPIESKVRTFLS